MLHVALLAPGTRRGAGGGVVCGLVDVVFLLLGRRVLSDFGGCGRGGGRGGGRRLHPETNGGGRISRTYFLLSAREREKVFEFWVCAALEETHLMGGRGGGGGCACASAHKFHLLGLGPSTTKETLKLLRRWGKKKESGAGFSTMYVGTLCCTWCRGDRSV